MGLGQCLKYGDYKTKTKTKRRKRQINKGKDQRQKKKTNHIIYKIVTYHKFKKITVIHGVLSQATKNKTYTPKNICSSVSKDRSHGEYLA